MGRQRTHEVQKRDFGVSGDVCDVTLVSADAGLTQERVRVFSTPRGGLSVMRPVVAVTPPLARFCRGRASPPLLP